MIFVRSHGRQDYVPLWRRMQSFTDERGADTADEIWFAEHPPVYTLGMNARPEHLLAPGEIPVVQTDRGGQVTYHGPGQIMVYPLIDLRRAKLGVRDVVTALEQSAVSVLLAHGLESAARRDAPGVYVEGRKVASVGLRIRRGATYHGMALNVNMDLEPFSRINPCGFPDLEVTDLRSLGVRAARADLEVALRDNLIRNLGLGGEEVVASG